MKIKHKLIKEFQYLGDDKKIIVLKVGTILEEYIYKLKTELIPIDKDIVDGNPDFFEKVEWKAELLSYLKVNKIPQPAVLSKKLYPFMEEFILSYEQPLVNNTTNIVVDEIKVKELEEKESELERREKRIRTNEDDSEERIKRIQKREDSYKDDVKSLDKKEQSLIDKLKEVTDKELDANNKLQDLNERERNLENEILESSKNLDGKYTELQDKINNDIKIVTDKEKDLEKKQKEIKLKQDILNQRESDIDDKIRDLGLRIDEHKSWEEDALLWEEELLKLNGEIKDWEGLHWKFQRNRIPPSAIQ